jgi:hypothetical protein
LTEPPVLPDDGGVLLHICCGPCAVSPVEELRAGGFDVTGFWYNPNIHPLREYRERLDSCRKMASLTGLPMLEEDRYGLQPFLEATFPGHQGRPQRCSICYRMRLRRAARAAREAGIPLYTTSLLVSPYQDRRAIIEIGSDEGRREGVVFLAHDFRQGFREGRQKSRTMGLYQQSYCGCIFSEAERVVGGPRAGSSSGALEQGREPRTSGETG